MNRAIFFLLIISLAAISGLSFASPVFANLVEFQNYDYGVSIKYPAGWEVDNEVVDYGAEPGYDKGIFSIVYFLDSYESFTKSIEIVLTKEDTVAKNNQGQKYLDRVESRIADGCETLVMAIDGVACSNYNLISSEISEINGLAAYKFTRTWTEHYPDESVYDLKGTLVDIVEGNDVWTIDGVSIESEFEKFSPIFDDSLETFTLMKMKSGVEEKIPGWVKNTMEWFVNGLISEDEMISAIEFLVNEGIISLR